MNNLAYSGQDPQKFAPKVEELLRKELGAAGPVAYEVEAAGAGETGAASLLKDAGTFLFGGSTTRLVTLHFHLTQPRTADLDVHMNRQGLGCYAGSMVFSTVVGKSIGGEVSFGDDGKFAGDAGAAGKLNSSRDLLKKCNAFAMKEGGLTGFEVKNPRFFKIAPGENGAQIVGATMARSKSMGFSASFGSKEFFELAGLIEGAL
jgi:hypothetical protein